VTERRPLGRRLGLGGQLLLALLPTATVLIVLFAVRPLTEQPLLLSSLASSAFLIYRDPEHDMNAVRTLLLAQLIAAATGLLGDLALGAGYPSAGAAMMATILLMVLARAVHPPAVSTAMSFALKSGNASHLLVFALAAGITAVLVALEQLALWRVRRRSRTAALLGPG
jgi:CBS-domain-containing membrane protein